MSLRCLVGPLPADLAPRWQAARDSGRCRLFNTSGEFDLTVGPADTWASLLERVPPDWRPDFLVQYLGYATVPPALWQAPVPIVGVAIDWNLLWHNYRRALRRCDLILTDTPGVEALAHAGLHHARPANLFGCTEDLLHYPWPDRPRDIDILFVGDLHPDVQRERLSWLGRIARLSGRWNVVIRTGVFGAAYRDLLSRTRIVFNRSVRGECNIRAFEAAAAGALLFQEAGNREVPDYFRDRQEAVYYSNDDLEALLDHYLKHEDERRVLAEAARAQVPSFTAGVFWERAAGDCRTRMGRTGPAIATALATGAG